MRFEPQRIGAQIDLTRPFQAASTLPDSGLCEKRRVAKCRENAGPGQMQQTANSGFAIRPCQGHAVRRRIGDGAHDDILKHPRHLQILSGASLAWHLIQFSANAP